MENPNEIIVAKTVSNNSGKTYMEVDGKPFLYNAVQSWYPPEKDYTMYIKKTAEANFKCFSFWLYWKSLEPSEGTRDWKELDKVIDLAKIYDIRVDIIWGGTNFCNHIDPRFTPEWILNNSDYRQKDEEGKEVLIDGRDMGPCYMANAQNKDLLKTERGILIDLINHLKAYDKSHRVIAIQVENEINLDGYFPGEKPHVMKYINELGRTIKEMDYKIVTRTNICAHSMDPDIDRLEFIDGHGVDTYDPRIGETRGAILDTGNSKFKYIAENAAFENSTSHIVAALANGGFYNIYKIDYDVYHRKPGVYDENWKENITTLRIRNLNEALNKIGSIIAQSPKEKMLELNTESDEPLFNYYNKKELCERNLGLKTFDTNPVAMIVEKGEGYFFIADMEAILISEDKPLICQNGYFNIFDEWICTSEKEITKVADTDYQVKYLKGECLLIKFVQ